MRQGGRLPVPLKRTPLLRMKRALRCILALPVAEAFPCRKSKKSLDNPGSRLLISTAAGTEETPALFLRSCRCGDTPFGILVQLFR